MCLVFYISGHGFGHATRSLQLLAEIARRRPGLRLVLRTTVPEWFLRAGLDAPFELVEGDTDTGVVQPDGLTIDAEDTARRAAGFYTGFDRLVAREAARLQRLSATLVVGDIPPLAFAAAAEARLPSVAFGNFTWDWIYGGFSAFDTHAPGVRAAITRANACATLTLRLPFAGGFHGMRAIEDIPLVARQALLPRDETRRRLGLRDPRPVVLASFGGHGGSVPLGPAVDGSFLLVATDYEVPDGLDSPDIRIVSNRAMRDAGVSYTDLLAAADAVVTKLGYGIVSECLANGVALLYTLRGDFIEQEVFMREMPRVMRTRLIAQDELRQGAWGAPLQALLAQPSPLGRPPLDGAGVAAERVVSLLQTR